ncbi:hypothetical protein [Entomomonas moraniae]|nr:hypothetical protein [Entomomonas moraniae]
MGLSIFLLTGCGQKEYTLEEAITPDSTFGVNGNTSLDEIKSKLTLREVQPNIYVSNEALKPYKLFDKYTYVANKGKICSVQAKKIYDSVNSNEMRKDLSFLKDKITSIYGDKAYKYTNHNASKWVNDLSNTIVLMSIEDKEENKSTIGYSIFIGDCPAIEK